MRARSGQVMVTLCALLGGVLPAVAATKLAGLVVDPQGRALPGATVSLERRADSSRREVRTDAEGRYGFLDLEQGEYRLRAESAGFAVVTQTVRVGDEETKTLDVEISRVAGQNDSVTVTADLSDGGVFAPDPAQRVMIRDETLDANPGRPGMPLSIPGIPVESPAGGVKPPQYFVPGVAGDHGEPIAMFFRVGGFLFQNNLPANAHGNGYADPNVIIPIAIEDVEADGGAFNVREGNNAVNTSIVFGLRERLEPVLRLTADARDLNLVGAWSARNPANKSWVGAEVSYGNGFLKRLEHRKQYKANASKVFELGKHRLTAYGIGYYGASFQPGLIPIDAPVPDDTVDARQREETANGAAILNDVWQVTAHRQFQFSGFYRYYTLDVRPNFGDGLIRQSEHRNVNSEDVLYSESYNTKFGILAGMNLRREAPSELALDKAEEETGRFRPVTSNNLLLNFYSPFVAVDGRLLPGLHYDVGYRDDEVRVDNQDLFRPELGFARRASVRSPKATVTYSPPERISALPVVSYSYGESFHVNDPRIGTTAVLRGTIVSKARSHQLVVSKTLAGTEVRLVLEHVTTAQQLARISNDTGLQQDVGPGLLRSLTLTARRTFAHGFVQGLYARADARDRVSGAATPEAPRLIWDVLATVNKLPGGLVARAEYEQVGRKPLGDGFGPGGVATSFVAVPVREFRGALTRPFEAAGVDVGVNFLVASGYGGQTVETLAVPGDVVAFDRMTGFPVRSYVTGSVTYHFRRK